MFMRTTQFSPQVTYNENLGALTRKKLTRGEAKALFNNWLQFRFPAAADRARGFGRGTLQGMDATAAPTAPAADAPWWQAGAAKLFDYAPQAVAAAAQYKLIKTNMKRAEKGLPPIDTAIAAPTVRVQTELDPQTRQTINYVGYGAAALGALVGLKLLKVI
jgi:hypothetical protein